METAGVFRIKAQKYQLIELNIRKVIGKLDIMMDCCHLQPATSSKSARGAKSETIQNEKEKG